MWESDPPPADDPLRQGDLLRAVPVASFDRPPVVAQDRAIAGCVEVDCVVISQCCTVAQRRVVTVAALQTMRLNKQRPEYLDRLRQVEPEVEGRSFVTFAHLLDPHPALELAQDRTKIVDLLRLMHFTGGDFAWLQAKRVARMSPEGRRALRIKLGAYWARPEEDDEAYLSGLGLPVGPSPPAS